MIMFAFLALVGAAFMSAGMGVMTSDDDDDMPINPDPVDPVDPIGPVDPFTGDDTNETFAGTDGADRISAGGGDDTVYGGDGRDSIFTDDFGREGGNDTAFGGDGNDYIRSYGGKDVLDGGFGNDTLGGDNGDDVFFGGGGNDTIEAGADNDTIFGGAGDDDIEGASGNKLVYGGDGDDRIDTTYPAYGGIRGLNTSEIFGGDGDDAIRFEDGSTVTGGLGADEFLLEDILSDDLVSRITDFDPDEDSLIVNLTAGDGDGGGYDLVDRADGAGKDLYLGDDLVAEILSTKEFTLSDIRINTELDYADGVLTFAIGDDDPANGIATLRGSYGDDTILGGTGDDVVFENGGVDELYGGDGDDRLFADGGSFVTFDGDQGGPVEFETVIETDTLFGGAGNDILVSTNGNVMTGGEGADFFGVVASDRDDEFGDVQFPFAVITDFDPAEDVMALGAVPGDAAPVASDVSVVALADGTGADILLDGIVVARVMGGQSLQVSDIVLQDAGIGRGP